MTRGMIGCVALATAFLAAATDLHAQRRTQIGVAAGLSVPTGDLGDGFETGFHVLGTVVVGGSATSPIGFRIDGMYNSFGGKSDGVDLRIISVNGNVVFSFSGESSVTPFILGGLGIYNSKVDFDVDTPGIDDDESETDLGLNLGVGARFQLSGFSTFAELRLHNIFSDPENTQFIPLTFGILF